MSNEASIRTSLQIKNGSLDYRSNPTAFRADVSSQKGPTPGNVIASPLTPTLVSLTALVYPGLCRIQNLDTLNFVLVGIFDGTSFYPMMELLPGESYVFRLPRYLGSEYVGTGTNSDTNTLRVMADPTQSASCNVLVEAFEK